MTNEEYDVVLPVPPVLFNQWCRMPSEEFTGTQEEWELTLGFAIEEMAKQLPPVRYIYMNQAMYERIRSANTYIRNELWNSRKETEWVLLFDKNMQLLGQIHIDRYFAFEKENMYLTFLEEAQLDYWMVNAKSLFTNTRHQYSYNR